MNDFVRSSLKSFNVSATETRVGIVQYGERTEIKVKPKDGTSVLKLEDVASKLIRIGGVRRTDKALKLVNTDIFGKPGEVRPEAEKVLILLTTGKSSDDGSGNLAKVARELRDQDVEIIVVRVGKDADPNETDAITGKKDGAIAVKDPNKLKEAVGQLEGKLGEARGRLG